VIVQKLIIKEILKLLTKQFKLDKLVKYVVEPNELDEKVESLEERLEILEHKLKKENIIC
tara:strand:- start:638 stop:817 length:180 start_codon:yes stop_codon:yes gene_type:complete